MDNQSTFQTRSCRKYSLALAVQRKSQQGEYSRFGLPSATKPQPGMYPHFVARIKGMGGPQSNRPTAILNIAVGSGSQSLNLWECQSPKGFPWPCHPVDRRNCSQVRVSGFSLRLHNRPRSLCAGAEVYLMALSEKWHQIGTRIDSLQFMKNHPGIA